MKKFPKIMLITLAFGLVTALIGFLTSRPATAQQPEGDEHSGMIHPHVVPVNVTNTPLPVTGTVNVGNFPATQNVNVTNTSVPVSGTVGVSSVSSLPNVTLNNSNTNPLFAREVDNPANEPFAATLCYGVGLAFSCYLGENLPNQFLVPTTTSDGNTVKELVIKFIDGACLVPQGGFVLDIDLKTTVSQNVVTGPGGFAAQNIHLVPFSSNPSTQPITTFDHIFQFATPTQIMANPNTNVMFVVDTNIGTTFRCTMNLSGYMVTQ